MKTNPIHYLLVVAQFGVLLFAALVGKTMPNNWFVYLLYSFAILLAMSAVYSMKLHTLTALPMPKQGSKLCQSGPYRVMRHPMYSSLLLIMLAFLINDFNWWRVLSALLLCVVIFSKIKIEEKALLQKFDDYSLYTKKTWAIVPYIY